MPSGIVDPNRFALMGAVTDWLAVSRRQPRALPAQQIAAQRGLSNTRVVQLRWVLAPDMGYPTEPFRVWRRPARPLSAEKAVPYTVVQLLGSRALVFDRPRAFVRLLLTVGSTGGALLAFAGAPFSSPVVSAQSMAAGTRMVTVPGPAIRCLVISGAADPTSITGIDQDAVTDPAWELVEIVGLPVDERWNGVFSLGAPQGRPGTLREPRIAALERFFRGAPFYGWDPGLTLTLAAPPWRLAHGPALVELMRQEMLGPLLQMVTSLPPSGHAAFTIDVDLPLEGSGRPAQARFPPLPTLLLGAVTDPLASLVSGFGTAIEDVDLQAVTVSDNIGFLNDPQRSDWDFLVTARYERGLDGSSAPAQFAALLFAPAVGLPPPTPTNLTAVSDGLRSPATTDADWRGVVRVGWDRVDDNLPFRVGSYGFCRTSQAPVGATTALMNRRPRDIALQPISATTSAEDTPGGRLQALDESYALASTPNPNALLYGVAHQDLFGLWSPWATTAFAIGEPPVAAPSLLAARLDVLAAGAGPCPASLVVDLAWDWASRSPARIELRGRLYAQPRLGDPPADLSVPTGLQIGLASGPGAPFALVFSGAAEAVPQPGNPALTVQVQYLSFDGKTFETTPPSPAGPRRYRVTVQGFSVDFNAAPRVGLAMWARGVEQRPPQRQGAWSAQPTVASTADPRPPVMAVEHEDVIMASVADAAGAHHARLEWPAAPGAAGYFAYTTTENKLLADRGLPEPLKSATLSERLAQLRTAFAANPDRRSFTRVNDQLTTGTSLPVILPRGSKEIHLYLVLAVSAGQVESAWPATTDPNLRKRPLAYAAPQIVLPAPPDLEVSRVLDTSVTPPRYRALLRVRSKPGVRVNRVDLHRVRVPEAAAGLDTMGPAIARVSGSSGDFAVTPDLTAGQPLGTIVGRDSVEGSWKRVFYRAVAWAGDDGTRGLFGGRSSPSALREVIVPPAGPPPLSDLAWAWPGGAPGQVRVTATTSAPVLETPLGAHRLRVDVLAERPDGSTAILHSHPGGPGADDRLESVPTTPPPASGVGLWRATASGSRSTSVHLDLQRASTEERLKVRFLMTDPLGRATERLLTVPGGAPLVPPDIVSPRVSAVRGRGFLLTFITNAPFIPSFLGPYRLEVSYQPSLRSLASRLNARVTLPELREVDIDEDLFADRAAIPIYRRNIQIIIALRTSGGLAMGALVNVVLTAPDGRIASLQRQLP